MVLTTFTPLAQVTALILDAPAGITTAAVAAALNVTSGRALALAKEARLSYGFVYTRTGKDGLWATPSVAQRLATERAEQRQLRNKTVYHQRRADGVVNTQGYLNDPDIAPMSQRTIEAGTTPPPKTTAARSVFELTALSKEVL